MLLELIRLEIDGESTIGELRINREWFAWTLEDRVRAAQIPDHQTAIPTGNYKVIMSRSQRFRETTPEVLDVPDFLGVRILPGDMAFEVPVDTNGCVLIGLSRQGARITELRKAYNALIKRFDELPKGDTVTLSITQPKPWPEWGGHATAEPVRSGDDVTRWSLDDLQPAADPISHPTDNPIFATVDTDRAWRVTLVTWMLAIGIGGIAWLKDDYRLLNLVAWVVTANHACWTVRSVLLDLARIKVAAEPNKYTVH